MEVDALKQALQAHAQLQVIDVRSREEYEQAHIPSALHLALLDLPGSLARLDKQLQYVTVCGKGGGRSAAGAQLLQRAGFRATWLCGGTSGWLQGEG